jgi:ubiquinone/menaquinone biosynthesis C-methylase UbiE
MPTLIDRGMRNKAMRKYRPLLAPQATGRVLELGFGSGLNLAYYTGAVSQLFALEPSGPLLEIAGAAADRARFPVTFIAMGAEEIPLETASIDTVTTTWTLCSIPKVDQALREARRVLKPSGRLLFMEHGRAPDKEVERLQDRLSPVFRAVAGCNINRPIAELIEAAGFRFGRLERSYLEGPRFIAYHYIGEARPG